MTNDKNKNDQTSNDSPWAYLMQAHGWSAYEAASAWLWYNDDLSEWALRQAVGDERADEIIRMR